MKNCKLKSVSQCRNMITTVYDCGKKLERPEQEWAVLTETFKSEVVIKKELKKQIGKRDCDICRKKEFEKVFKSFEKYKIVPVERINNTVKKQELTDIRDADAK